MNNQPLKISMEERVELFEKDFLELLKKHKLNYSVVMDFPIYKILPDELKLALIIIDKHQPKYQLGYSDKEAPNVADKR